MEDQILQKYRKYKKVRIVLHLLDVTLFSSTVVATQTFIFRTVVCDSFLKHK